MVQIRLLLPNHTLGYGTHPVRHWFGSTKDFAADTRPSGTSADLNLKAKQARRTR